MFSQEYLCEFLAAPGSLFDPLALDDLFSGTPQQADVNWLPPIANGHAREWL
jgi:hypothetical protein